MKSLKVIAAFLLLAGMPHAFSQTETPPAPTVPLVHRAPEFASWTITLGPATSPGESQGQPSTFSIDVPQSILVEKTGRTYHEVTTFQSGKKSERWISNNIELITLPGSDRVTYNKPNPVTDPDYFDFNKSDFTGLDWLSLKEYRGVENYGGKLVFAFGSQPTSPDDKSARTRSAMLSVKTQLPLYTVNDDNWSSTYTYNPPPTAPLVPPDNFRKAFHLLGVDFK